MFAVSKRFFLDFGAEIAFVTGHHTVAVFPTHILEIMEVMDICSRHVIGVYDTPYSTDSMEFISIIMQSLRCAIAPVGSGVDIVTPHRAAFCPCVLTLLYRFGIDAEHILGAIHGYGHVLSDFLGKACRQLAPDIELPAANKVRQLILAFIVQTIEQKFSLSKPNASAVIPSAMTSRSENLGTTPHLGYFRVYLLDFRRNLCRFREF